jgi:uncharacterized protein (DUF924 family)
MEPEDTNATLPEVTTSGLTSIYIGTLSKGVKVTTRRGDNRVICYLGPFSHSEVIIDDCETIEIEQATNDELNSATDIEP